MAFINSGGNVISFAEYSDVTNIDQRVFEANEGLTSTVIEDMLIRATSKILYSFGTSDWWIAYYMRQSGGTYDPLLYTSGLLAIPNPDPNKIQDRQADFTDLCVFYALSYYVYPKIADFSKEDNAEKKKIGFFNEKFRQLFQELIDDGSWYDFSGNGTITPLEKMPIRSNVVRVR